MELQKALDAYYYSEALFNLRMMNHEIVGQNVTYNSLLYLELIYEMKGTCTASKLAEMLCVSKPGVTLKINELVKQGLVIKTPDENDRRQNFLSVNEEKFLKSKIYHQQDAMIMKRLKENYSDEEIQKFCEMLSVLTDVNYEKFNV